MFVTVFVKLITTEKNIRKTRAQNLLGKADGFGTVTRYIRLCSSPLEKLEFGIGPSVVKLQLQDQLAHN